MYQRNAPCYRTLNKKRARKIVWKILFCSSRKKWEYWMITHKKRYAHFSWHRQFSPHIFPHKRLLNIFGICFSVVVIHSFAAFFCCGFCGCFEFSPLLSAYSQRKFWEIDAVALTFRHLIPFTWQIKMNTCQHLAQRRELSSKSAFHLITTIHLFRYISI